MPPSGSRRTRSSQKDLRVLQISDDQNLAIARLLLLEHYGYRAEHFYSEKVGHVSNFNEFQAVLICQSVPPERVAELIDLIRREAPVARIVRVQDTLPDRDRRADVYLPFPGDPALLLRTFEALSRTPQRRSDA